jgi:hypothetical protein
MLDLQAWGLFVRPSISGTCYTSSCTRIRLARLHVLCLHTVDGRLIFLDLATRLVFCLPASSGTTSYMMHLTVHNDHWFLRILFQTLASRAYVTCYQAQGLSGYTSPDIELFLLFDPYDLEFFISYFHQVRTLTFLLRNTSGYTLPGKKIFIFWTTMQSSSTTAIFINNHGLLIPDLDGILAHARLTFEGDVKTNLAS